MLPLTLFNSEGFSAEILLPDSWNEFDEFELKLFRNALTADYSRQHLALSILSHRVSLSKYSLPSNWEALIDADDATLELLPLVDHWLANNNLTKQPLPIIDVYHGPRSDFDDLLVGEYEEADYYFSLYSRHRDNQHLVSLAACLWRPHLGAKRTPLKDYIPDKSFFNGLDNGILQLIYLWFSGCRAMLTELFPNVFDPKFHKENDDDNENENEKGDSLGMMTRLIHSAAGERNGTRDNIRWNTLIKELLYDCELQIENNNRIKEEMKNAQ